MNVDEMAQQFSTVADLKAYANSQFRTIVEQSKKIHSLEEEITHLKKLLSDNAPLVKDPSKKIELYNDVSDQEAICRMELTKLKTLSIERDLSLEEAKRTEIYTKLLISLTEKSKKIIDPMAQMTDDDLLKLLSEPDEQAK